MNEQELIENGEENNKILAEITDWLISKGYDPFSAKFKKAVNLIKDWEENKKAGEKNEVN